ncbi:hypothetical protein Lal_00025659 [Lupinus albus]|uniref:Putative transcription factor MYB-HB-like family n=1 Tax=Lupinus albus TaxID=3870 RepID=A0A6A4PZZ5_LUPAL|nr:putative transcription factor MYB-HB-like family [Lupinus albus]KAF1861372.1 hypothetical protein Lal_00025659 [Lupinus albus]
MGRVPCCDKANVKKGPWSSEEDTILKAYIEQQGTVGNWIALPQKIGIKRCGKSCRLRWLNYLRPNIKHGGFSEEEDNVICSLYVSIGSRWSIIAAQLPGRTDNDIKNYWNTRLKKKLNVNLRKHQQAQTRRVTNLKQEIKREPENFAVAPGVVTQTSYWPAEHNSMHMQMANNTAPIQHCDLNNQTFFRNLLLNNNAVTATFNSQVACDASFKQEQQIYPITMNMINPFNSGSGTCPSSNIFQGFENFPNDLSELVCVNPQQIDGSTQGFYGMESMDMINNNGSTNTISTESTSWGEMNSLVYSPLVSDYEGCAQGVPQDITFDESRYFGIYMQ